MGDLPAVPPEQIRMAQQLMIDPNTTGQQVMHALHVSRAKLYRALQKVE